MAKVLLVEDDNNLREIYEARLQAEGYETATASDGEQALVVAKEAKPDLVISDVMMPKISGFEMLDILRNTDGLKEVKVIMLTALGQAEDKTRADQLGADKYLVKSQVTLEDIVKTAHQLLDDTPAPAAAAAQSPDPVAPATPATSPPPAAATTADETKDMQAQIDSFAAQPAAVPAPEPVAPATPAAATPAADPAAAASAHDDQVMASAVDSLTNAVGAQKPSDVTAVEVAPPAESAPTTAPAHEPVTSIEDNEDNSPSHKKVIKPLSDDINKKPDLDKLLEAEQAAQIAAETPQVVPEPVTEPLPSPLPEPAADPSLQVSPEIAAALAAEDPSTPTASEPAVAAAPPAADTTYVAAPDVTEPPADPNKPNPNEIAL